MSLSDDSKIDKMATPYNGGGLPLNIGKMVLPTQSSVKGSTTLVIPISQEPSQILPIQPVPVSGSSSNIASSSYIQANESHDISNQQHTSIFTDPGCSFHMVIADSKGFRQLIDYCKQKNTQGFFYVSPEGLGYSRHDNDSTVINLAFLYRDSMLDFCYESSYPSIGFHLDMNAFLSIIKTVKKDQISIEKSAGAPEIGIRPVSHNDTGDNMGSPSITFLRPLENKMLSYLLPTIDSESKPICVVSMIDFCNKCNRVCSSSATNIRIYSFAKGIFFQATDPATQTVVFQVLGQITQDELKTCPVPPKQAGTSGKQLVFSLSGQSGTTYQDNIGMIWYKGAISTMLVPKETVNSFLKLGTITRDSIVRIYMGPGVPTRVVLPINYMGELVIMIRTK